MVKVTLVFSFFTKVTFTIYPLYCLCLWILFSIKIIIINKVESMRWDIYIYIYRERERERERETRTKAMAGAEESSACFIFYLLLISIILFLLLRVLILFWLSSAVISEDFSLFIQFDLNRFVSWHWSHGTRTSWLGRAHDWRVSALYPKFNCNSEGDLSVLQCI